MPFIKVITNQSLGLETQAEIRKSLGQAIRLIPGKSETWLMVEIEESKNLSFQGSVAPCAMIEVKLYGRSNPGNYENLTSKVTEIVSDAAGIAEGRIYVEYEETPYWGMGGSNF